MIFSWQNDALEHRVESTANGQAVQVMQVRMIEEFWVFRVFDSSIVVSFPNNSFLFTCSLHLALTL